MGWKAFSADTYWEAFWWVQWDNAAEDRNKCLCSGQENLVSDKKMCFLRRPLYYSASICITYTFSIYQNLMSQNLVLKHNKFVESFDKTVKMWSVFLCIAVIFLCLLITRKLCYIDSSGLIWFLISPPNLCWVHKPLTTIFPRSREPRWIMGILGSMIFGLMI